MNDERDPLRVRTTEAMVKTWAKESIAPTPEETIAFFQNCVSSFWRQGGAAKPFIIVLIQDANVREQILYRGATFAAALHLAMRGRG